jgi:antitoxin HicB
MTDKINAILAKHYTRRLSPDETGGYVASIHEFPGCIAEGDTPQEAIQNLDAAAASWVAVALANGYGIREPVAFSGFSGKIALRIPRGLHKQAAELAELEECSLNHLITTAVSEYVGGRLAYRQLSESVCSEVRQIIGDGIRGFVSLYRNGPTSFVFSFPPVPNESITEGRVFDAEIKEQLFPWPSSLPQLMAN